MQQFLLDMAPDLVPRYNIAPTQPVSVVRIAPDGGRRELVALRWGLVPSWAKDPKIGNRMINARAETVAQKPAFRAAFRRRRCLVAADGYYEWQKTGKARQPYYIRLASEEPFALAGLWEYWEGSALGPASGPIESCTIITTGANELTREIHDRMPVIVGPDDYAKWLDVDVEDRRHLDPILVPYASDEMKADQVSAHVNSPRNDDPQCVEVQRRLF